jgi:hypothetical protein
MPPKATTVLAALLVFGTASPVFADMPILLGSVAAWPVAARAQHQHQRESKHRRAEPARRQHPRHERQRHEPVEGEPG